MVVWLERDKNMKVQVLKSMDREYYIVYVTAIFKYLIIEHIYGLEIGKLSHGFILYAMQLDKFEISPFVDFVRPAGIRPMINSTD